MYLKNWKSAHFKLKLLEVATSLNQFKLVQSYYSASIIMFLQQQLLLTVAASVSAVLAQNQQCQVNAGAASSTERPQLCTLKLQICGIRVEPENRLNGGIEQRLDTQHSLSMHKLFITLILFTLMWLTPKDCSRVVCRSSFSTVRLQSEHTHRGSCRALGVLAGCAVPFWPEMLASEGTTVSLRSHRHKRQRSPAV